AEMSVGVKLFSRKGGRYSPTMEANAIFSQINGVYDKVEDLQFVISRIKRGSNAALKIGSVPSIATIMVPEAIADLRAVFPNLLIDVDILKIEDAVDYLLLGKGELVALSSKFEHPMLTFEPLARGRLKCIVPEGHALARQTRVSARDIAAYPLIGVDPNDPYGRIVTEVFARHGLHGEVTIRARFGTTVCALVSDSASPSSTSLRSPPATGRPFARSTSSSRRRSRRTSCSAGMWRCRATARPSPRRCAAAWRRSRRRPRRSESADRRPE